MLRGNIARYRDLLESGQVKDRVFVMQLLADAERELCELEIMPTHNLACTESVFRTVAETAPDEAIWLTRSHFGTVRI